MPRREALCVTRARRLHPLWRHELHCDNTLLGHPDLSRWTVHKSFDFCLSISRTYAANLVRLCAMYVHGGISLDCDIWMLRSLDEWRGLPMLVARLPNGVAWQGLLGAPARSEDVAAILDEWTTQERWFDGTLSMNLWEIGNERGWTFQPSRLFCPFGRREPVRIYPESVCAHLWGDGGNIAETWVTI